jgi:hypothetical protein
MAMFGACRTHNGKVHPFEPRLRFQPTYGLVTWLATCVLTCCVAQGVTIPSQRRYIRYYQTILSSGGLIPPPRAIQLQAVTIHTIPNVCYLP